MRVIYDVALLLLLFFFFLVLSIFVFLDVKRIVSVFGFACVIIWLMTRAFL